MTATTAPPRRGRVPAPPVEPPTGLVPATVTAACVAAAIGLIAAETVVLLAWASDARSSIESLPAARAGLLAWLLAHGAPVSIPGGVLSVAPLGLTVLLGVLLVRAGQSVVRRTRPATTGRALVAGAAVGVPYSLLAALVTGPATIGAARPAPVATMFAALGLGAAGGAVGAAREVGFARVAALVPARAAVVVRAAAVAVGALVVTGAVGMAAALAAHGPRVGEVTESLGVGLVSGFMLAVVSVLLAPVAVVWCAAYALGTGFAIGAGTSVAPTGVRLGPLPAFPLLAALPGEGGAPAVSLLLLAGPLTAGVLAGLMVVRGLRGRSPAVLAAYGLAVGPVTGVVVGIACVLAGGGIGTGRLAVAGPSAWVTALAAAEWVGLVGAATAYLAARRPGPLSP